MKTIEIKNELRHAEIELSRAKNISKAIQIDFGKIHVEDYASRCFQDAVDIQGLLETAIGRIHKLLGGLDETV